MPPVAAGIIFYLNLFLRIKFADFLHMKDGAILEANRYFDEAKALLQRYGSGSDAACANHVDLTAGLLLHTQNQVFTNPNPNYFMNHSYFLVYFSV